MDGMTDRDLCDPHAAVPVFFLSDSTGISAETMGNALLIQFPDLRFERTLIPFITDVDGAREVVEHLNRIVDGPVAPLVFITAADELVRTELLKTRASVVDFFGMHMEKVESVLGKSGIRQAARLHGLGDIKLYNNRMAAVEFTIEHDDGQSLRALDRAEVILLAPSRCGKTPTSMYLGLQHGLFVANYPLVDEDLADDVLPQAVLPHLNRCFGLTTTVDRLSRVRNERRPGSRYASVEHCRWELRRARDLFSAYRLPTVDTSAKSVEEISTLILQHLKHDARSRLRQSEGITP